MKSNTSTQDLFTGYSSRLQAVLAITDWTAVTQLANDMLACWQEGRRVFLCGNGGSAGATLSTSLMTSSMALPSAVAAG